MQRERIVHPRNWWQAALCLALTLHFVAHLVRKREESAFYLVLSSTAVVAGVIAAIDSLRRRITDIAWSPAELEVSSMGKCLYSGGWDGGVKVTEDLVHYLIFPPAKFRHIGLPKRLLSPELQARLAALVGKT